MKQFQNMSGRISKRGSPLLRQALFLAANVARHNDENLKRFYDKKLRIVYWVLKNNKEYQTQLN